MLNGIIRFALQQRMLIVALALLLLGLGSWELAELPVDVFPDLDRPRVVVLTEAPGLAPEEVETLINIPLEQALNGAAGVEAVRSSAGIGVSVIFVEFAWGTDIRDDRQVVNERLDTLADHLPPGVQPKMAPRASIMGQIMLVGMYVEGQETRDERRETEGTSSPALDSNPSSLDSATSMLELRQLADWVVRPRLMNLSGTAQVFTMGGENGGKRQIQVLINPDQLRSHQLSLHEVERAVLNSNVNATGGYVETGQRRLLVRSLGRLEDVDALKSLVVDGSRNPPLLLEQVARIQDGPEIPIGRAALNGKPAVMLVIAKQPGVDTRKLTKHVLTALDELQIALPADVKINANVYRMDRFIDRAIANVLEALRDGSILVVIILFVFLLNLRTTLITLTAIPLSIVVTILVFRWLGMSINTMTLGGLAVAMGELVDDAIVDVENIYRRLRENWHSEHPRPIIPVVYEASVEIRRSIVFGTLIVVLVFIPLFALGGMSGRLFAPLGVAYIVSILASLLVSLTVTPVLSAWLLGTRTRKQEAETAEPKDSILLAFFKAAASGAINLSLRVPWLTLGLAGTAAAVCCFLLVNTGRGFLPPFNEGNVQVNVTLPAQTSLEETNRIVSQVDRALLALPDVKQVGRRTGRAEEDEHVAGVYFSELILELEQESSHNRQQQLDEIRAALNTIPGVERKAGRSSTEQPIQHLMSHMISGVKAQIAIKIYGDDLGVMRSLAQEARHEIESVEGIEDLMVEQQVLIPQLQIKLDRRKLAERGLTPGEVNHVIETAMNGRVMTRLLEGQAIFDVVVRLDDRFRENIDSLKGLALPLPSGGTVPLVDVADFYPDQAGPNEINRENGRRRIIVQCNTKGRALSDVRNEIQQNLAALEAKLPSYGAGYYIEYSGQLESEEAATRMIVILSAVSLCGIFLALYTMFRSANLALQVMAALPMSAIGAFVALRVTGQDLSVPAMVGFISLTGIASRNGILLLSHYLHLMQHEGEILGRKMILRAGRERVAPVLMTALTSGIGLVPLALAGDEPGKEILYPVATVIIGGLISTTLLEFFVRPALFWKFGRAAAARVIEDSTNGASVVDG